VQRTFTDYYRCPEEFTRCFRGDTLPSRTGYFRFGPQAICYGTNRKGAVSASVDGGLYDALKDVVLKSGEVHLSFDSDEVVDNLRFERYSNGSENRSPLAGKLANKLYYCARPFLGVGVRRHLQKLRLADWQSIPFPRWPIDQTVEQLHEMMLRLCVEAHAGKKVPFIWFWPDAHTSCVSVTHDVEAAEGRDLCPALMDLDESFGIRSSFQLVPEKRYALSSSFLEDMRARGFEVNVHDLNHDGRLFSSESGFFERVERINQYGRAFHAKGFRSGALYRNLAWYEGLDFSYDMSVPNAAHLDPQRGGCCTLMPYFVGKILELPVTTTQDYSLFHILNQYSTELWEYEIRQITDQHGLASFIIHPDYLVEPRACDTYKSLLAFLAGLRSEGKVWFALPREVNDWWRARSQMKLVEHGNNWEVEGPEKDRARVVYAVLHGDRLAYEPDGLIH
jgi:hypothetical protein